jgi:hypothetical protein
MRPNGVRDRADAEVRLAEWRIEDTLPHAHTAGSPPGFITSAKGIPMETLSQAQFVVALASAAGVGIGMLVTLSRSQIVLTQAMAARVAASIATLDESTR